MENIEKMNTAKVTDAEILKALDTPYNRKWVIADDGNGDFIRVGDIIDLVNRTQAKNKELDEKLVIYKGTIDWQAKEINRQKAEIERLTTMHSEQRIGLRVLKRNARKQFAERLKDKMRNCASYCSDEHTYYVIGFSLIDNLLEEMEGDS